MTRYADPHRCPDCRHTIAPHSASCPACGLVLSGETARQLFVTLTRADEQLAALRTLSRPAAAATTSRQDGQVTPVAQVTPARQVPATPSRPVRRPAGGLSAASVPKILLTLGAGCLLVAAIVFLAVTWSVLGVGGRTATLVGFTAVAGLLTWWMARRGLRAAAESLGLVGYGLLTLDVVGADNAGWFGDLPVAGLLVLLGATLAASGVAGALLVARSTTVALVGAEVVAAVGTGLAAYGLVEGAWLTPDASALVATMLAAAAVGAAHRFRLVVATAGAAVVAAMAWLSLASLATARALDHATWSGLWLDLHVWPLLAAAVLAAGPALLRRLPSPARVSFLAVAELLVVFAAVAPMLEGDPTRLTVVAVALLLVAAVAMVALPRPWGMAMLLTQVVVGASVLAVTLELVQVSAARLVDAGASGWSGRAGDVLPDVTTVGLPAGWLIPFCVLALTATGWALTRCFAVLRPAASLATDLRLGAAVLVASLVATLAWYPVPLWLVLAALLLSAGCFTAWWRAGGAWGPLVPAAAFLGSGVLVSLHAEGLTLAALVVTVALTGLVHLRAAQPELAAAGGAVLATALGGAVWTAGSLVGAVPAWVALVGLLVLGLVVLAGPYAPRHWWTAAVRLPRIGLEAGAGVTALVLGVVGVADAGRVATWAAVYLTVAGVLVTVMSLLRRDRRNLAWLGGGLLALASWVRLWDLGVQAPEAYTLPSAGALLVVGLLHLRRNPGSGTVAALGPGLGLALVPSLLWTLDGPTGPRALLLGLACLALVLAGARLRWTAPLAIGAAVGGLLVLRLAAPYIGDSVPRWVLFGAAGALLIAVGVTWERRLQEARDALTYVRALR